MLRAASKTLPKASKARAVGSTSARSFASQASTGTKGSRAALLAGTVALAVSAGTYFVAPSAHADAPNFYGNLKDAARALEEDIELETGRLAEGEVDWIRTSVDPEGELISLIWGSNKYVNVKFSNSVQLTYFADTTLSLPTRRRLMPSVRRPLLNGSAALHSGTSLSPKNMLLASMLRETSTSGAKVSLRHPLKMRNGSRLSRSRARFAFSSTTIFFVINVITRTSNP
jgi:hypothetical protein